MSWITAFGPEYDVPSVITDNLPDVSWRNDASPSFGEHGEGWELRLWVEHVDVDEREVPGPRYMVYLYGADEGVVYSGDDVDAALAAYRSSLAEQRDLSEITDLLKPMGWGE